MTKRTLTLHPRCPECGSPDTVFARMAKRGWVQLACQDCGEPFSVRREEFAGVDEDDPRSL